MVSRIRTLLLVMLTIAPGLPALSNAETHGSTGAVFVMTNAASATKLSPTAKCGWLVRAGTTLLNGWPRQRRCYRSIGVAGIPHSHRGSLVPFGGECRQWQCFPYSVWGVRELSLVDRVPCGGAEPVAVAQHGNLVYVLNAGGTSNVVGFRLERNGRIKPIPNSIKSLQRQLWTRIFVV